MRRSPEERRQPGRASESLKDEHLADWHPDRISDRKLIELRNRLEMVRRLGDAFADIGFSEPLEQRLRQLNAPSVDAHASIEVTVAAAKDGPRLTVR